MKKIAVIGSTNVDMIMKMKSLPDVGETVTDAEFLQTYGGKGANQAVAAARAGGDVAFVSCVGEDHYSYLMIENFKRTGMNTEFVMRETGITSGTALIMIGEDGNNYLSVAPGANYRLSTKHIDRAKPVIDPADIILLQYEITVETLKYVIDLAHKQDKTVIWNFAPAREFDMAYLKKISMLVVNEVEAGFLAGVKIQSMDDVEKAAWILSGKGPDTVIITLGAHGSYVVTNGEQHLIPAFKVVAVDTTAAGDAYCGGLAVALAEGKSLEEAVRFASAAAGLAVRRLGAQPSIPMRMEIDAFLKKPR